MLEDGDGIDRTARDIAKDERAHAEHELIAVVAAARFCKLLKIGVVDQPQPQV